MKVRTKLKSPCFFNPDVIEQWYRKITEWNSKRNRSVGRKLECRQMSPQISKNLWLWWTKIVKGKHYEGSAANRPVVDEWKLIKRQDNLVKSVVLWPNHCNERLGLISKQVLSSNRKMKVKILHECFSLITETSAYTFKNMAKIANVHPSGVNTSGWTNLTKLAKDRQNCHFCQIRQNHRYRQCSPKGCQYQWMN